LIYLNKDKKHLPEYNKKVERILTAEALHFE